MKIFRALLFVATLVVTATCPLVWALFGWAAGDHSSAAVGGATTALAANDNRLNNVNFNVSNDNGNGNRHHGNDNGVFTGVESIASGPDCDAGHERVIGAANGKVQLKLPTGTN